MTDYYSSNNGNDGSQHSQFIQYRFLVPQPAAGGIIGRKGENIKRLRSQYGCEISVPANDAPERLVLLNADECILRKVLGDILNMVKDCMHAKVNDPKDINNNIIPDSNTISPEMDLRFLVSENVCGAIIGKGGEVIRRLTDTFKVSVFKVYQQMCPGSTDRVIRLVGMPDDIINCLLAIHDIILGLKDIKSPREYDPSNCNEIHAVNYGGWMSLEGRRHLARMGGPPPPTKGPTESRNSAGMGPQQPPAKPTSQYFPPQPTALPATNQSSRPTPVFAGIPIAHMADYAHPDNIMIELNQEMYQDDSMMGFGPPPAMNNQKMGPQTMQNFPRIEISHVSLPNKLIGAIMGRGGCRINDIREETGARIDVDKEVIPETDERVITIQGTREQIQHAQILLQGNVKKYGGKY